MMRTSVFELVRCATENGAKKLLLIFFSWPEIMVTNECNPSLRVFLFFPSTKYE
jgi:hypothetical protein